MKSGEIIWCFLISQQCEIISSIYRNDECWPWLFMTCHTQALTGVRLWYNIWAPNPPYSYSFCSLYESDLDQSHTPSNSGHGTVSLVIGYDLFPLLLWGESGSNINSGTMILCSVVLDLDPHLQYHMCTKRHRIHVWALCTCWPLDNPVCIVIHYLLSLKCHLWRSASNLLNVCLTIHPLNSLGALRFLVDAFCCSTVGFLDILHRNSKTHISDQPSIDHQPSTMMARLFHQNPERQVKEIVATELISQFQVAEAPFWMYLAIITCRQFSWN